VGQNQGAQLPLSAALPSGDYLVVAKEGERFLVPMEDESIKNIVVKRPQGVGEWVWERFQRLRQINVEDGSATVT
jgi:hypothetical protein